jgi:hypothetical protein
MKYGLTPLSLIFTCTLTMVASKYMVDPHCPELKDNKTRRGKTGRAIVII